MGDIIQASSLIEYVYLHYKPVKITLLTTLPFKKIMSLCPYIEKIEIEERASICNIRELFRVKKILNSNFTYIIDFQNSQRTYLYKKFLSKNNNWISTKRKVHKISALRSQIEMLQENSIEITYSFKSKPSWIVADINSLLIKNKIFSKYIVLLPGSSAQNKFKRWPYFKKLALILMLKQFKVITILGPEELDLEFLMPGLILKNLDLGQLSGVIDNSYFVFGNDSGPCHIASFLNKDGLAIFGPSTSAQRADIKRGNFDVIESNNLNKLNPDEVFKKMIENLS